MQVQKFLTGQFLSGDKKKTLPHTLKPPKLTSKNSPPKAEPTKTEPSKIMQVQKSSIGQFEKFS